jgi:hypothetical protein
MTGVRYRILVRGEFDEITAASFEDVALSRSDGVTTLHTGELDQAGLFGLLQRIQTVRADLLALTGADGHDHGLPPTHPHDPPARSHRPDHSQR